MVRFYGTRARVAKGKEKRADAAEKPEIPSALRGGLFDSSIVSAVADNLVAQDASFS
jgi:hypothetical protein